MLQRATRGRRLNMIQPNKISQPNPIGGSNIPLTTVPISQIKMFRP